MFGKSKVREGDILGKIINGEFNIHIATKYKVFNSINLYDADKWTKKGYKIIGHADLLKL
ncbi:hypothetical protein OYT88_04735 [Sporolactobacillus sp. CQH2019]|uniref:hypothetical protein n=1 Tax=Sporolactobacillus sp. CQH2019 TaxID=3023512 RepID=UPI00236810A0|nr:hypothetical protein [Sporolactobacillus sp. CQH2019]MDD9147854.1 hypothetical protein [Sporolactobacillus sp. CQH2019]